MKLEQDTLEKSLQFIWLINIILLAINLPIQSDLLALLSGILEGSAFLITLALAYTLRKSFEEDMKNIEIHLK